VDDASWPVEKGESAGGADVDGRWMACGVSNEAVEMRADHPRHHAVISTDAGRRIHRLDA
jgi:hypothetical protein